MCLAHAVTVPERFKGGTCSFGAPAATVPGTLPRGFKRPVCSWRAHHCTHRGAAAGGPFWEERRVFGCSRTAVTGLCRERDGNRRPRRYRLFTLGGEGFRYLGTGPDSPQGRTHTVNKATAYATTTGVTLPERQAPSAREACGTLPAPVVRDLRERAGRSPHTLLFGPRDLVVVTGLPGSGKSTLMRRATRGTPVDSQDTRDRWDRSMPRLLPYAVYRPLVRLAHYAGLRRALRTGEGVVVHDCGTQAWVRRWLARRPAAGARTCICCCSTSPGAGPGRPARARPRGLPVRLPAPPRRHRPIADVRGARRPARGLRFGRPGRPRRGERTAPHRLHGLTAARTGPPPDAAAVSLSATAVVPGRR